MCRRNGLWSKSLYLTVPVPCGNYVVTNGPRGAQGSDSYMLVNIYLLVYRDVGAGLEVAELRSTKIQAIYFIGVGIRSNLKDPVA